MDEPDVPALRDVLADEFVEPFDARALVGRVRVGEVDVQLQGLGGQLVFGEFPAVVIGDRVQLAPVPAKQGQRGLMHSIGLASMGLRQPALVADTVHDGQDGAAVGRPDDGVALQVAEAFQLVDFRGALADPPLVFDDLAHFFDFGTGFGPMPGCPRMLEELPACGRIGVDMPVDGRAGHPHVRSMQQAQARTDARRFQIRFLQQSQGQGLPLAGEPVGLAGCGPGGRIAGMGRERLVTVAAAAPDDFPADAGRVAAEPVCRQAGSQAIRAGLTPFLSCAAMRYLSDRSRCRYMVINSLVGMDGQYNRHRLARGTSSGLFLSQAQNGHFK